MKPIKTTVNKAKSKSIAPVKMESALTNLNHIVHTPPPTVAAPANGKSGPKGRSVKPVGAVMDRVQQPTTAIEAKVDVGFGNVLFIRGHGPGLSWEKGVPLDCRDHSTWLWSARNGSENVEFKLLLNDQVWAAGENGSVAPGEKIEVVPTF